MSSKPFHIRLLRDQIYMTGGAIYEEILIESIENQFNKNNAPIIKDKKIYNKKRNLIRQIFLVIRASFYSNADVNIVTAKLALSSIVRNLLSKNKTVIVFHNFDVNDNKKKLLKFYYFLLFKTLSLSPSRVSIVCVSPFFLDFFQTKFKKIPVFHIPNLFENEKYKVKDIIKDNKKILLGQYATKLDDTVYTLAKDLNEAGYFCYFLTLNPLLAAKKEHYEIINVPFSKYLSEMASSYCTIAFTRVNEGWNRMAHESILVGTPVIGYERGGLGDLLRESDSYIVNSSKEALNMIERNEIRFSTSDAFMKRYDLSNASEYLVLLLKFMTNGNH